MSDETVLSKATELGTQAGESAATWVEISGAEDALAILRMSRDEVPHSLSEHYRAPSFSGEYSGEYDVDDFNRELGIEIDWTGDDTQYMTELADECATAYEAAASGAFYGAIDRHAADYLMAWVAAELEASTTQISAS